MKRTPLTRKTPLRRGSALKKGKPLAQQSKKRKGFMALYRELKEHDMNFRLAGSGLLNLGQGERHHPFGRKGKYLLIYCHVEPALHNRIHDEAKWARETGWLQPPFEGRPYDPSWPRPWKPGTLINEHLL